LSAAALSAAALSAAALSAAAFSLSLVALADGRLFRFGLVGGCLLRQFFGRQGAIAFLLFCCCRFGLGLGVALGGGGRRQARHGATGGVAVERAQQGQLGLRHVGARIDLQRLVIGLAGQLGIDVAQVFQCGGIGRIGAHGHVQRRARLVVLAVGRVQHGQVVVRLRQVGEVLGELGEHRDGLGRTVLFC
jgi:hypothetical protein